MLHYPGTRIEIIYSAEQRKYEHTEHLRTKNCIKPNQVEAQNNFTGNRIKSSGNLMIAY